MNKSYSQIAPQILEESDRKRVGNQLIKVLSIYLGETKNLNCLDLGCSSGVITNMLADNFSHVIGLDTDELAIDQAKKDFKKKNLEFILVDNEKVPYPDKSFDVIICNQVYEFVNNQKLLFDEIYRVLKPGGICLLGARNKLALIEGQTKLPFIHFLPNKIASGIANSLGRHYYPAKYLTSDELKKTLNNFEVTDMTVPILKDPAKYNYFSLIKFKQITQFFNPQILYPFLPNYILILKRNS